MVKDPSCYKYPNKLSFKIPVKITKLNNDFVSPFISKVFNESIENASFPDNLKLTHKTLIFKKNNRNDKVNYRPVSILPALSKTFEKIKLVWSFRSNFKKM